MILKVYLLSAWCIEIPFFQHNLLFIIDTKALVKGAYSAKCLEGLSACELGSSYYQNLFQTALRPPKTATQAFFKAPGEELNSRQREAENVDANNSNPPSGLENQFVA